MNGESHQLERAKNVLLEEMCVQATLDALVDPLRERCFTQQEIEDFTGIDSRTIRKIERRAIRKIRTVLYEQGIRGEK